jgi:RHS repeat-associated protein
MPTTTNYIWDEENLLAEADGTNAIQTVYTNEPEQYGNLVSTRLPVAGTPTTVYHHFDATGSTRQLTNPAGSVSDTMIYDAWGNVVARTGSTAIVFLWVATVEYYFDIETGDIYIRERTFGPALGRWASCDALLTARSPSPYAYAANRPVDLADPSGLDWQQIGDSTVYKCTQDGDTLDMLATQITGTAADSVCIWPVGDKMPLWAGYPTAKKGACADVQNLTATTGPTLLVGVRTQNYKSDGYLFAMNVLAGTAIGNMWDTADKAAAIIAGSSGAQYGATPIRTGYLIGHGGYKGALGTRDGKRLFYASSLTTYWNNYVAKMSYGRDAFSRAKGKQGPPRCWFTRNADVWGIGCTTGAQWLKDWTSQILRCGSTGHGTTGLVAASWQQLGAGKIATEAWMVANPTAKVTTLADFLQLDGWTTLPGIQ